MALSHFGEKVEGGDNFHRAVFFNLFFFFHYWPLRNLFILFVAFFFF